MTANYDPKGLRFYSNGKEMMYCYPDCERESLRGWICYKHPDGQWVTLRKATDDDLQRINQAVVLAHHSDPSLQGARRTGDREMSKPYFTIQPHSTIDKEFDIYGPGDLTLRVDFDDVDHASVEDNVEVLVAILNQRWKPR